ncbi:putative response regulator rpfG [Magnetospirillum sp. XM-1]|uniref:response regulator n=1 Tax=Magnetospirillum sp. XM-1 TaxID=1663591 RepID=UPI00073DC98B|nr:two-component system response regulator [Magnetospirillum sp. XM-1]CUW41093.1 putative response regulator rpfG [Magnetospirillum sp. XM-1]
MTGDATYEVPLAVDFETILVVDDTPENLTVLGELLRPHYRVRAANCGERALRAAGSAPRPDLILLDVMMPDMDGYTVLKRLRADPVTQGIPVIFVTAMSGMADEEMGLSLGAVDYITKPFQPAIVLARVRTHLELKQARDRLLDQNQWLEKEVARRMRENLLIQDLSIRSLACLAEARDNETGHHILRTQSYVRLLAEHLGDHPRFRDALAGPRLEMIVKAAPLHDIGKVGIPDAILLKPGRLTPDEYEIMKTHAEIGAQAIDRAMSQAMADAPDTLPDVPVSAFSFLQVAREISIGHHEKWDGTGYPRGLSAEAIPVSARLMALADVFDALICRRVYKKPLSPSEARAIIVEGKGRHFDPDVVDAFIELQERFTAAAERYADTDQEG